MSVWWNLAYRVGYKPWDSGIPPPELVQVVEGADALVPGRALDLGCGTGTNAVYLAQHGWDVTAIDLVGRAVEKGRQKAAAAGVSPRILRGDVTRLEELGVGDGVSLVFDLGCLHGIPHERRDAYVAGVTRATQPGATYLHYGVAPGAVWWNRMGISADELRARFTRWELVDATRGTASVEFWWYKLRRRA